MRCFSEILVLSIFLLLGKTAHALDPKKCAALYAFFGGDPFFTALEAGRQEAYQCASARVTNGDPKSNLFDPANVRSNRNLGEPLNVAESAGQCGYGAKAAIKKLEELTGKRYVLRAENIDSPYSVAIDLEDRIPSTVPGAIQHQQAFAWNPEDSTVTIIDATFAQVPHMTSCAGAVKALQQSLPSVFDSLSENGVAHLSKNEFATYMAIVQNRTTDADFAGTALKDPDVLINRLFRTEGKVIENERGSFVIRNGKMTPSRSGNPRAHSGTSP